MKRAILILIITLAGFWTIFLGLQNNAIYNRTLGIFAQNWENKNGERKLVDKPFDKLTNHNYIRWDALHYHLIKESGYNIKKAGGDYIFAFFPLFPAIWRISSLPPIGILFLNYIFFSVSILILLKLFSRKEFYKRDIFISLSLPSLIIFLIPYSEATFILTATIGIYGFIRNKYWIFFIGFLLASLTRPSYTFLALSIIATEFYFLMGHKKILISLKNIFLRTLPLLTGTAIVSVIQLMQGSENIFKFIEVQKYWDNILRMPHNLRDWSHEGFSINIGVVFLIFVPLAIIFLQLCYYQLKQYKATHLTGNLDNRRSYLIILSIVYLIGTTLFIILFRGEALTACSGLHCALPFFSYYSSDRLSS